MVDVLECISVATYQSGEFPLPLHDKRDSDLFPFLQGVNNKLVYGFTAEGTSRMWYFTEHRMWFPWFNVKHEDIGKGISHLPIAYTQDGNAEYLVMLASRLYKYKFRDNVATPFSFLQPSSLSSDLTPDHNIREKLDSGRLSYFGVLEETLFDFTVSEANKGSRCLYLEGETSGSKDSEKLIVDDVDDSTEQEKQEPGASNQRSAPKSEDQEENN